MVQGGSTITQQVAKVMFLSRERTFARKLKEYLLSKRIENHFKKEEILEIYLNQIYYGHGTYGVEAAARLYFDKGVGDLSLGELATLAGLPKAPNSYSPFNNPRAAVRRRNLVINRMLGSGYITKEMAQTATEEKLKLGKLKKTPNDVPYFAEHVRRHLFTKYGSSKLYHQGLKVYTTLDESWQINAQNTLMNGIEVDDRRIGYRGALGFIDPSKEKPNWDDINPPQKKTASWEYFAPGKRLKALVKNVTKDAIMVEVNGVKGVIRKDGFSWAHKFDPKADGRNFEPVSDATKLLKPGQVIEVKIIEKSGNGTLQLALDQTPALQGALVCMDYSTGEVRAMVGGYDFEKSSFNRAVQAQRQPGSAFKPIIYAAALDKGFTPASIVIDSPITFEGTGTDWKPGNFKQEFYGPTTIRTAVIESRNIVTVKVLQSIGLQYATEYARQLGLKSKLESNLSIGLGSSSVNLLELTSVYSVLANGGVRNEPYFIRRIEDNSGQIIERTEPVANRVMPEDTAFLMNNIMQGVVEEGTGQGVRALGVPTAGKTGTTNDFMDAWFIGYTSGVVTGVWVGRDQEETIGRGETGGHAAAPIWLDYMRGVIKNLQIRPFMPPKNIVFVRINKSAGLLAKPNDEDSFFEAFREGTEPKQYAASLAKTAEPVKEIQQH
ncbi:MAG: PBP1A family penicillin-binding protein [Nitrospinae bacterium]|nr:PBP1A family penicillin-binding protein [Nitrospinota bacterium]